MSGDMVEGCRLGLGDFLWSHTSHHQHQQELLCLIHLLPPHPMQGLQSFRGPLLADYHTLGMGSIPGGQAGLCGWGGFLLVH